MRTSKYSIFQQKNAYSPILVFLEVYLFCYIFSLDNCSSQSYSQRLEPERSQSIKKEDFLQYCLKKKSPRIIYSTLIVSLWSKEQNGISRKTIVALRSTSSWYNFHAYLAFITGMDFNPEGTKMSLMYYSGHLVISDVHDNTRLFNFDTEQSARCN